MTAAHLRALRFAARKKDNRWGLKLADNPNAGDCLLAVARMGGHLKRNGAPGWLTLARGFEVIHHLVSAMELMELEM